ncbi:MAG: flippase [Caldilineaceae bacterium]
MNNAARLSKNMGVLFFGRAFDMVISFAFVVYIARYLGVEGFGKYALAQRYFELFMSLAATSLATYITREIAKEREHLHQYLNAALLMVIGLTVVADLILISLGWVFGYAVDTRLAINLVAIALFPATIGAIIEAVFIAHEKAEYVSYGLVGEGIFNNGLGLLALLMGYGLTGLFVVLITTRLLLLLFYLYWMPRKIGKFAWQLDWQVVKRVFREWRVFALENWISTIYGGLDVIALSSFQGEFAVGIYVAAQKLLRLGTIIAASYTTAMFPYMSRLFTQSRDVFKQFSESSLKYMLAFILPLAITIAVLADKIILLLYTDKYAGSIPVLRVLSGLLMLEFFNLFLSHVLFAKGEQRKSLYVAVIRIATFGLLSLILIPRWAEIGVAWTLLLTSMVAFVFYFTFMLQGEKMGQVLMKFLPTLPAAVVLVIFFFLLKDIQLIPLVVAGGVVYVVFLFVFRVVSTNDLRMLRSLSGGTPP